MWSFSEKEKLKDTSALGRQTIFKASLPSLSRTREFQEVGRGRHVAGRPCAAAAQSAATEQ
jgi:hypothetical protein